VKLLPALLIVPALCVLYGSGSGAQAQSAGAAPVWVVEAEGDVRLAEAGPEPGAIRAHQKLDPRQRIALAADGRLKVADRCGVLLALAGPLEGTLEGLLARTSRPAPSPEGCRPTGDDAAELRRRIILSFVEQSSGRVYRSASKTSASPDPWAIDLAQGARPVFVGDPRTFGRAVEVTAEKTGQRGLAAFDAGLGGWPMPDSLNRLPGAFRVSSRLRDARFELKEVPAEGATGASSLALLLARHGCMAQARRVVPRLPPDRTISGAP
jgi:hypothetical protein